MFDVKRFFTPELLEKCYNLLKNSYNYRQYQANLAEQQNKQTLESGATKEDDNPNNENENQNELNRAYEIDTVVEPKRPAKAAAENTTFKCHLCSRAAYKSKSAYEKHLKNHEEPLRCKICSVSYQSENALKTHEQNCWTRHRKRDSPKQEAEKVKPSAKRTKV